MRCSCGLAILAALIASGCGEDPFDTGPTRSAAPEAFGISVDTVRPLASRSVGGCEDRRCAQRSRRRSCRSPSLGWKRPGGGQRQGDYGAGILTTPLSVYSPRSASSSTR